MASINWLSSWPGIDISGKSEEEVEVLKSLYKTFIKGYIYGINAKRGGAREYEEKEGTTYKIAQVSWNAGVGNPNIIFMQVDLAPAAIEEGSGGGPGQINPTPPPPPK